MHEKQVFNAPTFKMTLFIHKGHSLVWLGIAYAVVIQDTWVEWTSVFHSHESEISIISIMLSLHVVLFKHN